MAKAKVFGIQHRKGTSKKGFNYDADVLHVAFLDPSRAKEFNGCEVAEVWCERSNGIMTQIPKPGDIVDIYFNRSGYPEEVTVCK